MGTKPFILVSIQRQTKNFAGKRKISSGFLSQNSFSYHFIFQFFVNPENFGNLCMFKKEKSIFAFVLKYQNSLKISPVFNEKIRQKPTTYYDTEDKRQKYENLRDTLKFEIVCDETKIRVRSMHNKKKER